MYVLLHATGVSDEFKDDIAQLLNTFHSLVRKVYPL